MFLKRDLEVFCYSLRLSALKYVLSLLLHIAIRNISVIKSMSEK